MKLFKYKELKLYLFNRTSDSKIEGGSRINIVEYFKILFLI